MVDLFYRFGRADGAGGGGTGLANLSGAEVTGGPAAPDGGKLDPMKGRRGLESPNTPQATLLA
jgi:hypothetical protein